MVARSLDSKVGGLQMEVLVNGRPLPVYKIEHDDDGASSKGYIASEIGKEYAVRLTYSPLEPECTRWDEMIYPTFKVDFDLDGNKVEVLYLIVSEFDEPGQLQHIAVDVPGVGAGASKRYTMVFAVPSLTENAKHLDAAAIANLSTIVAKFFRIRYLHDDRTKNTSKQGTVGGRNRRSGKQQDQDIESEYEEGVPDWKQGKKGPGRKGAGMSSATKQRGKRGRDTNASEDDEGSSREIGSTPESTDEEEDTDEDEEEDEEELATYDSCGPRQINEANEKDKKAGLSCLTAEKKVFHSGRKGKGKIGSISKGNGGKFSGKKARFLSDTRHEVHPEDVKEPFYTLTITHMTKDMLLARDIIGGRRIILADQAGDNPEMALDVDKWEPVFEEEDANLTDESDDGGDGKLEDNRISEEVKPKVLSSGNHRSLQRRKESTAGKQRKRKASSEEIKCAKIESRSNDRDNQHRVKMRQPNAGAKVKNPNKHARYELTSEEERDSKAGILEEAERRMAKALNKKAKTDGGVVVID